MSGVVLFVVLAVGADTEKFSNVEIERPFDTYLQANPLLMEATGAKIIRLDNGRHVILAVASTVLKDNSAQERLRAEKVCRVKALASVVAEKEGVQVAHVESVNEKTVIVLEGEKETGKSVSELLQTTKTKVEGITKDMPVVGRWRSKEGDVFYLALGIVLDKKGNPVHQGKRPARRQVDEETAGGADKGPRRNQKEQATPGEEDVADGTAAKSPTVEQLNESPEKYEGKTLVFKVQLSGKIVEGPARSRLTVKSPNGTLVTDKLKEKGITFVISKKRAGEIGTLDPDKFHPARLTCTISKMRNGRNWIADVSKVELLKSTDEAGLTGDPKNPKDPKGSRADRPGRRGGGRDGREVRTQVIEAAGSGKTDDEALKDAFRNAVQQVVGAVVDAETLEKNDDIISDKVLTYSGGFIKKYDQIGKKQDQGLIRIKIRATVERLGVIEKLKAANITVKNVDVEKGVKEAENRIAEEQTKKLAAKDAEALIAKIMTDFHQKILRADVVGEPEIGKGTEKGVPVRFKVKLEIRSSAYDSLGGRLEAILKKSAEKTGDFTTVGKPNHTPFEPDSLYLPKSLEAPIRVHLSESERLVLVNYHRSKDNVRTGWNYYRIDSALADTLRGTKTCC